MMNRKTFIAGSAAGLLLARGLRAQPSGKPARIGFLAFVSEPVPGYLQRMEPLRAALRDLGWIEGRNLIIEDALRRSGARSASANGPLNSRRCRWR